MRRLRLPQRSDAYVHEPTMGMQRPCESPDTTEVTRWHGSFWEDKDRSALRITFDCHGGHVWKSVFLLETQRARQWKGCDYKDRAITLTKTGTFVWDPTMGVWQDESIPAT